MAYVYILKGAKGRHYVGSTLNLAARLRHHRGGFTPSTKRLGELGLVFLQEYASLQEARKIERKLKSWKRRDFLEKIIRDGVIKAGT